MVYGLQALPVAPRTGETLDVYTMIGANGDTPVQRRLC
jgi:hypothetical protein